MKKIVSVFMLLIFTFIANAQINPAPQVVKDAFAKQYPDAQNVKWGDGLDGFSVRFTINDKKMKASYTGKSDWNWTETQITQADLPQAVQDAFKNSAYKDWPVKEVRLVDKPKNDAVYHIIVKKSIISKKILVYSKAGKLLEEIADIG
jgi:hypothetical protein